MEVKTTPKLYLGNSVKGEKFEHFIDIQKDRFTDDRQITYFVSPKTEISSIFEVGYDFHDLRLLLGESSETKDIFEELKKLK
jgi:hypothetical protein